MAWGDSIADGANIEGAVDFEVTTFPAGIAGQGLDSGSGGRGVSKWVQDGDRCWGGVG